MAAQAWGGAGGVEEPSEPASSGCREMVAELGVELWRVTKVAAVAAKEASGIGGRECQRWRKELSGGYRRGAVDETSDGKKKSRGLPIPPVGEGAE